MTLFKKYAPLLLIAALSGCGIFTEDKPKPLPGDRLTILPEKKDLEVSNKVADRPLNLMADTENKEWPAVSYLPNHAGANLTLMKAPKEIWRISVGDGATDRRYLLSTPVSQGDIVYTMDSKAHVSAFSLANGVKLWRVTVLPKKDNAEAPVGGLAVDKNRLFVTNGRRDVMALDVKNGGLVWRSQLPAPARSAPTVADGRVYVITLDNQLICINQDNGQELWRHAGISEGASVLGGSVPAVDGDMVIASYSSGEIFALRPENGLVVWSDSLSARKSGSMSELADIRGNAVIDQDLIVASSFGGRMAVFDRRTGERAWQQEIGSSQTPLSVGSWIFLISQDNVLMALDREKGNVRWRTQLDRYEDIEEKTGSIAWGGPVMGNGQLWLYNSAGKLIAVDPDKGQIAQTIKTDKGSALPPIIVQKTLLVVSHDGDLIAYR